MRFNKIPYSKVLIKLLQKFAGVLGAEPPRSYILGVRYEKEI